MKLVFRPIRLDRPLLDDAPPRASHDDQERRRVEQLRRLTEYERCGGGRRVIRKRIGDV